MPNDIIEVIQERLKMLHERELLCADECRVLRILVDEIEQQYIKLPLDADDVPIKPGDELVCIKDNYHFKCGTIVFNGDIWVVYSVDSIVTVPHNCRHVQPDTVDSILREFTDAVLEWAYQSGPASEVPTWTEMSSEYIERIRKAVVHD